jgi:hypothetical protein
MRPQRSDIAAPELPPRVRWLNGAPASMAELTASGPVLVYFFDFAQLNSVRALPYVTEWDRRYRDAGLTVLGIHSPRFPFTATHDALEAGVERLGVTHPVAQDSAYAIWHDYGVSGWPSLFLWSSNGALAYYHFGEGEYEATEAAIQDELRAADALADLPEPMGPLRPSDAPGALVTPPSDEVFPGGGPAERWRGEVLELDYDGAGAYAAVDGSGHLRVALDGAEERSIAIAGPGLYELSEHPRHERHSLRIRPTVGVDIYAVGFAAGLPQ